MVALSNYTIPSEYIKVRWKEPFLTSGINRKALGTTLRGLYRGFVAKQTDPVSTGLQLVVEQPKTGTGDSLSTLTGMGSTQILNDSAALFTPDDVTKFIAIGTAVSGGTAATQAGNNGTFLVSRYVSPSRIEIQNSGGAAETSPFSWSIASPTADSVAVLEDPTDGYTTTVRIPITVPLSGSGIVLPLATNAAYTGTGADLSAPTADGLQTLTLGTANWTTADVDRVITIVGASAGNNGSFPIVVRNAATPTQIGFINPNGVLQTGGSFTWTVKHRFWVILDIDYRQGLDTTGSVRIVNSLSDLAAAPNAIRICRLDVPTNATTLIDSYITQTNDSEVDDPDATTRPWAGDRTFGYASPGYRSIAVPHQQVFSSPGANNVTLSGRFYVGRGASGTANRYFALAQDLTNDSGETALLDATNNPITVNRIINPVTNATLVPSVDAEVDALGFISNPKVEATATMSTALRVLAYKAATVGSLTPALTATEPPRGFLRPAHDIPNRGANFVHLSTSTLNVQAVLEGLDAAITNYTDRLVTVGPTGSFADFRGSDQAPFISALAAIAAVGSGGGTIVVLPGTYTFTAAVAIAQDNIRITGLTSADALAGTGMPIITAPNAHTGALFTIANFSNTTFENLRFSETRTTNAVAPFITVTNTTAGREGPKFRSCSFATNAFSAGAISLSCTGSQIHFRNVHIDGCSFASCDADIAVSLSDVSSWFIRNNRYNDTNTNGSSIFSSDYSTYTGPSACYFSNNFMTGTGRFLDARVSGVASDESLLLVDGNTLINSTATGNLFGIRLRGVTENDDTAHKIILRNNSWGIQAGTGGVFLQSSTSGSNRLGTVVVESNYYNTPASNEAMVVIADVLYVTNNHFIASSFSGLTNGQLSVTFICRGNFFEFLGTVSLGAGNLSFPANSIVEGNYFKSGSVNTYLLGIPSGVAFIGNTIDMSTASSGTGAISLVDASTCTRVTISGNRCILPTARTFDFISGTTVDVKFATITDNYVQDCERFVVHTGANFQYSNISGNTVFGAVGAVILTFGFAAGCEDNVIRGNNFQYSSVAALGAGIAVGIITGPESVVADNILQGFEATFTSAGVGFGLLIGVKVMANSVVSGNLIKDMGGLLTGIEAAENCVMSNNVISDMSIGIQFVQSPVGISLNDRCTATGNVIRNINISNSGGNAGVTGIRASVTLGTYHIAVGNMIFGLTPSGSGTTTAINFLNGTSLMVGNVSQGNDDSFLGTASEIGQSGAVGTDDPGSNIAAV